MVESRVMENYASGWLRTRAGRHRKHFEAAFSDQNSVFPLGRQAVVLGDNCPSVSQFANRCFSGVNHRLNSENHIGLQLNSCSRFSVVNDLRVFVEFCADAMATEFAND